MKYADLKIEILSSEVITSPFTKGTCKKYYMQVSYNGKSFKFPFYDSVYNYQNNKKLDKKDTIYAILLDSNAVEYCRDEKEFLTEFGYDEFGIYESTKAFTKNYLYELYAKDDVDTLYKGIKAYRACLETNKALHEMFTDAELEELQEEIQEEFQDY